MCVYYFFFVAVLSLSGELDPDIEACCSVCLCSFDIGRYNHVQYSLRRLKLSLELDHSL